MVSGILMSCDPNHTNTFSSGTDAVSITKSGLHSNHQFMPENNQVIKAKRELYKANASSEISETQAPAIGLVLVLMLGVILSWKSKIWTGYEYA